MKFNYLLVPALLFISACGGSIGNSGTYKDIPGKVIITEVKNISNSTCPDSVQVYFDFKPDDPNAVKRYIFPNFSDTHASLYSNAFPSRAWVIRNNIKIGNTYSAKRSEAISGTATPYGFTILDKAVYPYQTRNADGSYEDICK